MTGQGRIRGTAWTDLCDSCSMALTGEGIRWRRRHLCLSCAEAAIRQDIAHGSMMLGAVARRRKEEAARRRKEKEAARQRDRRLHEKAQEEREAIRLRAEMLGNVRAHVESMMEEPPTPCPTCGRLACTQHPDELDEEAGL